MDVLVEFLFYQIQISILYTYKVARAGASGGALAAAVTAGGGFGFLAAGEQVQHYIYNYQ